MSELLRGSGEQRQFNTSHEEAIAHPALRDEYNKERDAAKEAGEPVWKIINFSSLETTLEEPGVAYNFYKDGGLRGYIEGDDEYGYHVYGPEIEEGRGPVHLNTEPLEDRRQAQIALEKYIKENYGITR